jgi:dethiobiotin synthetase
MSLPGIFVVGTDTGVGKTHVATSVVRALRSEGRRVGVLKPVSTGSIPSEDALRLAEAVGGTVPIERIAPIVYEEPLAPTIAARRAGTPLTVAHLNAVVGDALAWWSDRSEVMVVEGIGGLLCPLAEGSTVADLAIMLDYPLLIVAGRGLGTINHTLLTIDAARLRSLRIAGLVLNSPEPERGDLAEATCADELVRRVPGVALLAELRHLSASVPPITDPLASVEWFPRARPSRIPSPLPPPPPTRERAPSREEADNPCLAT